VSCSRPLSGIFAEEGEKESGRAFAANNCHTQAHTPRIFHLALGQDEVAVETKNSKP
jgi:hypothetical protein